MRRRLSAQPIITRAKLTLPPPHHHNDFPSVGRANRHERRGMRLAPAASAPAARGSTLLCLHAHRRSRLSPPEDARATSGSQPQVTLPPPYHPGIPPCTETRPSRVPRHAAGTCGICACSSRLHPTSLACAQEEPPLTSWRRQGDQQLSATGDAATTLPPRHSTMYRDPTVPGAEARGWHLRHLRLQLAAPSYFPRMRTGGVASHLLETPGRPAALNLR